MSDRPKINLNARHQYTVGDDKLRLPSVTTIIKETCYKDLSWWGMTVACEGIAQLYNPHLPPGATGADLVAALRDNRLTVNHRLSDAGDRGTIIHDALDRYAKTGIYPKAYAYPWEYQKRLEGLIKWLMDAQPKILLAEQRTASLEYGYAGTFDLKAEIDGKSYLIDLKTSKHVYPDQHFPQLEAYEQAEIECGADPTEKRAVLHLPESGVATLVESVDTFEDFRVLLDAFKSKQDRKARLKVKRKPKGEDKS